MNKPEEIQFFLKKLKALSFILQFINIGSMIIAFAILKTPLWANALLFILYLALVKNPFINLIPQISTIIAFIKAIQQPATTASIIYWVFLLLQIGMFTWWVILKKSNSAIRQKAKKEDDAPAYITKEDYGRVILSHFILTSGNNCIDLFESLGKEPTFADYLQYLQYLLYLSQKILEEKYSPSDVAVIIDATINGLIDLIDDFPPEKKSEGKDMLRGFYTELTDLLKNSCKFIHLKITYEKMADFFLEDCLIENTLQNHLSVYTNFSQFATYHAQDIIPDENTIVLT